MKKKLIEVALPLEAINKESAREKSIRHGHPSTLHLWCPCQRGWSTASHVDSWPRLSGRFWRMGDQEADAPAPSHERDRLQLR